MAAQITDAEADAAVETLRAWAHQHAASVHVFGDALRVITQDEFASMAIERLSEFMRERARREAAEASLDAAGYGLRKAAARPAFSSAP
jgi:hypothetical protein